MQNKFERSVSLICWAYNEEDSVQEYLVKATGLLDSAVEDYEIILIDDGSHDRTYEIASAFQKNNPRVEIFQNWKNMGVGISCQRAIKKASKEFLFWQTVDWCYDITDLRVFLEYLKKYDIVQGVRRRPVEVRVKLLKPVIGIMKLFGIKHLTKRSDTIPKAIVSIINYLLIRILFKIQLSDFQNVTFYPTSWIQSVRFETKSSFVSPEILIKAHWSGMSIKEVPINFIPRSQGIPKGTRLRSIVSSVRDIFKLWFRWVVIGKRKFIRKGKIVRLNFLEPS
ncbi:MAG: glycosyltransferase [Candidatus Omnitrophica bacterium]|nr:glycosyltransferase [Candidatus Omnitrophota bacterium]